MTKKVLVSIIIDSEFMLNEEHPYALSTRLEHIINTKLEELLTSKVPGTAKPLLTKVKVQVEDL